MSPFTSPLISWCLDAQETWTVSFPSICQNHKHENQAVLQHKLEDNSALIPSYSGFLHSLLFPHFPISLNLYLSAYFQLMILHFKYLPSVPTSVLKGDTVPLEETKREYIKPSARNNSKILVFKCDIKHLPNYYIRDSNQFSSGFPLIVSYVFPICEAGMLLWLSVESEEENLSSLTQIIENKKRHKYFSSPK